MWASVVWTDNDLLPNDMSGREPASLAPEPVGLRIKFLTSQRHPRVQG